MENKVISPVKIKRVCLTTAAIVALAATLGSNAFSASSGGGHQDSYITLDLQLGKMADYGATPWYTSDISLGTSQLNFALDTGANFIWATSDQCTTPACSMHNKVNTKQPGFHWVDKTPKKRSFGPWGSMQTWTGKVPFDYGTRSANDGNQIGYAESSIDIQFFASINYDGSKFSTLAWDGGIGFPARSDKVAPGSDFFFRKLLESGRVTIAELSMYTNSAEKTGAVYLGGGNPTKFMANAEVVLQPKSSAIPYLWGTNLYDFLVGQQPLLALKNQVFFIDSGSSRFKGDGTYIYPVLEALLTYKDSQGNPVFSKYYEDGTWTGLYYTSGGPSDYPNLPDIELKIGQSCYGDSAKKAVVTLDPSQYSYFVEEGDRQNKWVIAFHRLDGVGGLLVGSTFMDLFYTMFRYNRPGGNVLTQGDMSLYLKSQGEGPAKIICTSN